MSHLVDDLDQYLVREISQLEITSTLKEAITYSMFPGGKRIRPKIVLLVGDLLSVQHEVLYPTASALELLHASSLVHDDLPALDNDDFRRGRPSLHKAFPESTAILAADYMIGLAFRLIAKSVVNSQSNQTLLFNEVSSTWCNIQEGQVLDMSTGADRPSDPLEIYSRKTASLFATSFVVPSFFCNSSAIVSNSLRSLGLNFGLLFQVIDDLIDSKGEKGRGGESSDAKNNKETYCKAKSLDELMQTAKILSAKALAELALVERATNKTSPEIRALIEGSLAKVETR
jgi:geranylgeranyl pyrophosphate synthase